MQFTKEDINEIIGKSIESHYTKDIAGLDVAVINVISGDETIWSWADDVFHDGTKILQIGRRARRKKRLR